MTKPAPLDEDHDIPFLNWKLVLFGHNNAQHDILGITIHNSSQSHYQISWLVTNQNFVLLKKFAFVVKNFSYFNESGHRCAVALIVPDDCKQKQAYFKL